MVKQHIVKDNDSLQRLAKQYYGDSALWTRIADYNQLDYPYLTADQTFAVRITASGTVTFYLKSPRGYDTPIPANTLTTTTVNDRKYTTKSAAVLPAGAMSVDVDIECTIAGYWGNVGVAAITAIDDATPLPGVFVTNSLAIFNGVVYNVKKTGDTLLIPTDDSEQPLSTLDDTEETDYLTLLGGKDIMLNEYGDLSTDAYGDIATASGVYNIQLALQHRLGTEHGSLVNHPEYGSKLYQLVAKREPFIDKLINLEIIETILQDSRIEKVNILQVSKSATTLMATCTVVLVGTGVAQPVALKLPI
jgi:hypothetical protein